MPSISRSSTLLAFAIAATLAGCTANSNAPGAGDGADVTPTSTTATPPTGPGWHSYDATVGVPKVTWSPSSLTGVPTVPKLQPFGRVDLHTDPKGKVDRMVISPVGGIPSSFLVDAGGTITSTMAPASIALSTLDPNTNIYGATLGHLTGTSFDVTASIWTRPTATTGFSGTLTATITLTDRISPPRLRPTPHVGIADRPLPWEPLTLTLDEPAEGSVAFSSTAGALVVPFLAGDIWSDGSTRTLGATLRLNDWAGASDWRVSTGPLRDLAGNVRASDSRALDAARVPRLGGATLDATFDASTYYSWGPVEVLADCGDGKACLHIGPLSLDGTACPATAGGIAAWLTAAPGSMIANVRVATHVPALSYWGTSQFFGQLATPGVPPSESTNVIPRIDYSPGSFDTGFLEVAFGTVRSASDLGVAVGFGASSSSPYDSRKCVGADTSATPTADYYLRSIYSGP